MGTLVIFLAVCWMWIEAIRVHTQVPTTISAFRSRGHLKFFRQYNIIAPEVVDSVPEFVEVSNVTDVASELDGVSDPQEGAWP